MIGEIFEFTSREVPLSSSLSSFVHMVGTGMGRGRNLMYSVHGVEANALVPGDVAFD